MARNQIARARLLPLCGIPAKSRNQLTRFIEVPMTKRAAMMLSVSLLFLLSGCDNATGPGASPSTSSAVAPTASSTPPESAVAVGPSLSPAGTVSPWATPVAGASATSELCSLDAINGVGSSNTVFSANTGQGLTFEGWATTADQHDPGNISIVFKGPPDFQIAGSTGVARSDVASAYGPGVAKAGYKVVVQALNIPVGKYAILIVGAGGTPGFICNTKTSLEVK
jgi:hypothetical protein